MRIAEYKQISTAWDETVNCELPIFAMVYRDMTADEIAAIQAESARAEAHERHRHLTDGEVTRLIIRQQINTLTVDDQTALRMVEFYPEWEAGQSYTTGYKAQRGGKLWRCLQAHTAQNGWEPENAASLWTEICETHDGTKYDPIPYDGNMALEGGKYYTQSGMTYLCSRDTVNPVYNAMSELAGIYVEVIN